MNTSELIEQLEKELKPCPHCGGKAKIVIPNAKFMLKAWHDKTVCVVCTYCESMTRLFALNNKTRSSIMNEEREQKAIKKAVIIWNSRDKSKSV